jgi:hypothetical protein
MHQSVIRNISVPDVQLFQACQIRNAFQAIVRYRTPNQDHGPKPSHVPQVVKAATVYAAPDKLDALKLPQAFDVRQPSIRNTSVINAESPKILHVTKILHGVIC